MGFVATQNLHEGSSTETAYRWDVEKDSPLGFTLELTTIHREFFPVEIRIGVLKDSVKHGLFQTRTGKKFATDDIFVLPEQIDFDTKNLELRVFDKEGNELGNFSTATGLNTLPKNFPYSFKLVSYKDPTLKRIWVDLKIHRDGKRITQGASEVNHPFKWNDLNFYLTKVDLDQYGYPYAGLQIVKDPSVPVVFTGFGIICLGLACCLFSKHMKKNG
ncbi:MAG: cytochrome c biogenesis protein ResB [Proteobacteria bacterium]|nr:cytochrome c biogenesis protein ResB [Pseudomonadota bacterium]MBU1708480.1 cytochrome c biogenesis protein ResB [Pseudomonadota bacterium]